MMPAYSRVVHISAAARYSFYQAAYSARKPGSLYSAPISLFVRLSGHSFVEICSGVIFVFIASPYFLFLRHWCVLSHKQFTRTIGRISKMVRGRRFPDSGETH